MFGFRIIATIIITLIVVLGILSTNPSVGGFFETISDKFSGITVFETDTAQRDVLFSLDVNKFDNIAVKTRRPVNITIDPEDLSMTIKDGNIKPDRSLTLFDFRGQIYVNSSKIILDGKYEKFEFADKSALFESGTVKTDGAFADITIDGLALNELKLTNVTGKIIANEVETGFAGIDIIIESPLGRFFINEKIQIVGSAEKISIPSRNLNIG